MGSVYATIVKKIQHNTIRDLEETDPYYFIVKTNGKILSEGDLPMMKLKLDEKYYDKPFKMIRRDPKTRVAIIDL